MRDASIRFAPVWALAILVAGCGASTGQKQSAGRVEPASSGAGYDFRKEGRIPPPSGGPAQPETDVEEIPAIESGGLDVSEAEAPPDTVAPAAAAVDGFRIQVFASADRDVAQNARAVAEERLGMPAYLDLEGGVYKVRVGDFGRREDAAAALAKVRGQSYPDAWIVAARVNAP